MNGEKPSGAMTRDMTKGSPRKLLLGFALPVFLSQVFQQLYNTADALIVSRCLGDASLAAVSSAGTLIFMMVSFFIGAASGAGVIIARYFGARDHERVSRAIHSYLFLALFAGAFLTVVGVLCTPLFLRWMSIDEKIFPLAVSYFRTYFAGILAVTLYNVGQGTMNALGDSRHPLYYLILSSLLNVLLDLLFIAVLHGSVRSAALATILSQFTSAFLCLARLAGKRSPYPIRLSRLRFDPEMLRLILRNGLPAGVQNSVIAFANVIVQTNINTFGADATAAFGAYSKIEGFAFLPITSFTMALTTYTSQNLGAGETERAKSGARFGILAAVLTAETIGLVIFTLAPQWIGLFTKTPSVVAIGTAQCRTIALFYCLLAFSHSVAAVCRGAGRAAVPMLVMLVCWCLIRVTYILLIMRVRHEIRLIYMAYPITWTLSSGVYLTCLLRLDRIFGTAPGKA